MVTPKSDFEIALSFAGEQRDYVKVVADYLIGRGVNVYYDEYSEVEEWGHNLYDRLSEVYGTAEKHAVLFASEAYANKVFPNLERQSIQARALFDKGYLLPVIFDDTAIPGLLPTTKYIDARRVGPVELGQKILRKLGIGLETMIDRVAALDTSIIEEFSKLGFSVSRDPATKIFQVSPVVGAVCAPIGYKFRVGSKDEDRDVLSAVEEHVRSGAPLEIPAKYLTEFVAPKELRPLFAPDQMKSFMIEQRFNPDVCLSIGLEFISDAGSVASVSGIRMRPRHAGEVEAVFDNFADRSPLRIEVRPRLDSSPMTVNLEYKFGGSIRQAIEHHRFFALAAEGGTLRILNEETGLELARSAFARHSFNAPPSSLLEILEMLMAIQREFHVQFNLPSGALDGETVNSIRRIHAIITTGTEDPQIESIYWPFDQEGYDEMQRIVKGKPFRFATQSEPISANLFGVQLPLGVCCLVIDLAELSTRDLNVEKEIVVKPAQGYDAINYYPRWYSGPVDLPST